MLRNCMEARKLLDTPITVDSEFEENDKPEDRLKTSCDRVTMLRFVTVCRSNIGLKTLD